uniref:Uncharacterized protein n=1 Tax=Arundo donax TaxID=35708 RepID=A0A0A8XZQ2_ARUDO
MGSSSLGSSPMGTSPSSHPAALPAPRSASARWRASPALPFHAGHGSHSDRERTR